MGTVVQVVPTRLKRSISGAGDSMSFPLLNRAGILSQELLAEKQTIADAKFRLHLPFKEPTVALLR